MREFTKNFFSFSWALSLFGARQLGNLLQGSADAVKAFDSVTGAVVDQFGRNLRQTFEAGDKLQGEMVDRIFGFLGERPAAAPGGTAPGAARGTAAVALPPLAGSVGYSPSFRPAPPAVPFKAEPPACAVTADPRDSKFVEVHGSRMHYVDTGHGEPILFLHGNPVWSYIWAGVLPHVSPTARCIALDLIGMGLSDKPPIQYTYLDHVKYVEGFIAKLGLESFTLVLHDWGCAIGFYVAMGQEKNVRGLAFMEAMLAPYASWSTCPKMIVPEVQAFRNPALGTTLVIADDQFIDKVLPANTSVPFTQEQINCFRMPFLDPSSRQVILSFVQQIPIAGDPAEVAEAAGRYAEWLKKTRLPKLFLWTQPGLLNSEQDVEWAQRNLKNLKTAFLGQGIHFHQQEHPVEVGQEIARWHAGICRPQG